MLARVIAMRFDRVLGTYNSQLLCDFLKGKHVLSVRDHFLCAKTFRISPPT